MSNQQELLALPYLVWEQKLLQAKMVRYEIGSG